HQAVPEQNSPLTPIAPSPCAGWLPLESPGKPTAPAAAQVPYPAGLRKVGRFFGQQPSQGCGKMTTSEARDAVTCARGGR
ncbi:MAG: hypothetical protein WAV70_01845, partial [Anaerolineae bacterium]